MFSWLKHSRIIYILANLIVLPAIFIPFVDSVSNISFFIAFILLLKNSSLSLILLCLNFIMKNNSNYRFNLLLNLKGEELSRSDDQCVYLFAWCTFLRYSLIVIAVNQIILYFK